MITAEIARWTLLTSKFCLNQDSVDDYPAENAERARESRGETGASRWNKIYLWEKIYRIMGIINVRYNKSGCDEF